MPAKNPKAKPGLEFDIWNRKFIICESQLEGGVCLDFGPALSSSLWADNVGGAAKKSLGGHFRVCNSHGKR